MSGTTKECGSAEYAGLDLTKRAHATQCAEVPYLDAAVVEMAQFFLYIIPRGEKLRTEEGLALLLSF